MRRVILGVISLAAGLGAAAMIFLGSTTPAQSESSRRQVAAAEMPAQPSFSGMPGAPVIPGSDIFMPPGSPYTVFKTVLSMALMQAFQASDYATLDKIESELLSAKSKTPKGSWALGTYYDFFTPPDLADKTQMEQGLQDAAAKALEWTKQSPKSPAAQLIYAEELINLGWFYRGHGYASEVTREGWEKFRAYLSDAKDYLQTHKDVAGADPHWYVLMLGIAGSTDGDFDDILTEGLTRYPDYMPLYNKAVVFETPRWNHSIEELDDFIKDTAQHTKPIYGDQMYGRLYAMIGKCGCTGGSVLKTTHADWTRMRAALQEVDAAYPDPVNFQTAFRFACEAGDKDFARTLVPRLGVIDNPLDAVFSDPDDLSRCKAWAVDANASLPTPGLTERN